MSYDMIAILMFTTMMLMMVTGQRVFGAIGFVAVAAALPLWGVGGSDLGFAAAMKLMKWYPLLTLPMFIFMGYVLSRKPARRRPLPDVPRLVRAGAGRARHRHDLPDGHHLGDERPVGRRHGHRRHHRAAGASQAQVRQAMVTGVIQAGSSLGILIPPSVVLVLYAMIARQPVSLLWLAGVFPGLMMAGMFIVYIWIRCRLNPNSGPVLAAEERAQIPRAEKLRLLPAGVLPLVIFLVMMVPFVTGYTSLVEASVVGALRLGRRRGDQGPLHPQGVRDCTRETLAVSCMFMWIILAALAFGSVFDGLGAVKAIEGFFVDKLGLSPWTILILMQLSYLVMGTFLDDTAMLVIVAPLYVPLVATLDLGIDKQYVLIWYGVLYTITCQIAYMTPPFGYNLFLMRAMAPPEINIIDIYRSIVPFVGVMVLALILVLAFPEIALWLPQHVNAR